MPSSDPFSIRLPEDVYKRALEVIAATGGMYNRSELITIAVRCFIGMLPACPHLLEGYCKDMDAAVTQKDGL